MGLKRKAVLLLMITLTASLTCICIFSAAKNAGAFWSEFDVQGDEEAALQSGYVVVDALDTRQGVMDGIGPFRATEPSFTDADVMFFENASGFVIDGDTSDDISLSPWKEIKVATGQTLSKIAEDNGLSVKDIMTANELKDQNKLKEGQTLYIPASSEYVLNTLDHVRTIKKDEVSKKKQAKPVIITDYIVKDGDTLWSIASAFDIDINTLFGCNKLSDANVLKVGTKIKVPNQDGILHNVKSGQTIAQLAKEYGIFAEAISSANELQISSALTAGNELFLPGAKVTAVVETNGTRTAVARSRSKQGASQGGFGWPVAGKISSPYGWRKDPIRGGKDFHTGLDIRAPRGKAVIASQGGKVVHSGWMGGYGKTIVIQHSNGLTTLYAHCSELVAKKGAVVKKGQKIALVGSTGRSTGPHVHFEIRKNGSTLSPLKYLK